MGLSRNNFSPSEKDDKTPQTPASRCKKLQGLTDILLFSPVAGGRK